MVLTISQAGLLRLNFYGGLCDVSYNGTSLLSIEYTEYVGILRMEID